MDCHLYVQALAATRVGLGYLAEPIFCTDLLGNLAQYRTTMRAHREMDFRVHRVDETWPKTDYARRIPNLKAGTKVRRTLA